MVQRITKCECIFYAEQVHRVEVSWKPAQETETWKSGRKCRIFLGTQEAWRFGWKLCGEWRLRWTQETGLILSHTNILSHDDWLTINWEHWDQVSDVPDFYWLPSSRVISHNWRETPLNRIPPSCPSWIFQFNWWISPVCFCCTWKL